MSHTTDHKNQYFVDVADSRIFSLTTASSQIKKYQSKLSALFRKMIAKLFILCAQIGIVFIAFCASLSSAFSPINGGLIGVSA